MEENQNFLFNRLLNNHTFFESLQEREAYLLRHIFDDSLSSENLLFIKQCEDAAITTQGMLKTNLYSEYIINNYKHNYLYKQKKFVAECRKRQGEKAKFHIITGPPATGKSKIIKRILETSTEVFLAGADKIKYELATLLSCNINSPQLHEISKEIRDCGMDFCIQNGVDIIIEKIGDKPESLLRLMERVDEKSKGSYEFSLNCIHSNCSISRIRNALRFQKYDVSDEVAARMIPDDRIRAIGVKPLMTYVGFLRNPEIAGRFKQMNAFINETIFEPNKPAELVPLNNLDPKNVTRDFKFEKIKKLSFEIAHESACKMYAISGKTDVSTKDFLQSYYCLGTSVLGQVYNSQSRACIRKIINLEQEKDTIEKDDINSVIEDSGFNKTFNHMQCLFDKNSPDKEICADK